MPVAPHPPALPALIRLYLAATAAVPGILRQQARKAHGTQGADPARFAERLGKPTLARPEGRLVWLHAASVGEVASVVRLAEGVRALGLSLLVTTATATGAEKVAQALPQALHQFLPIDTPAAVAGFLDHWRPDAALFVEGDLWPRMVLALARRGTAMALLNARASRSRDRFPSVYAALLAPMALVTVQDGLVLQGLERLGLEPGRLHAPGNLKADVAPPAVDAALQAALVAAAAGRGLWAAVSTHAGEEEVVLAAQGGLRRKPLLLLAPRHPARAEAVTALLQRRGLSFTRHSRGEVPDIATEVHLIDQLGLTGSLYAASGLTFLGGSLLPGIGGHTPYEPAALGCAVLSGPHVRNFEAAYAGLIRAGAAQGVADARALGEAVEALLGDAPALRAMQAAALACHKAEAGATAATLDLLRPLLQRP